MPATGRTYHHGDLRSTLLATARETVEQSGAEALSFRELARKAKVSPGAPYHHFRDKGQLLAMVARQGFETLLAQLNAAWEAGADPVGRLHNLVEAYLAFARGSPRLYALLFIPEVTRPENADLIEADALACFMRLEAAMVAVDPDAEAGVVHERALIVWSLLHGLVTLLSSGPLTRKLPSERSSDLATRSAMKLALA